MIKKKSYRNKRKERLKFLDNLSISTPGSELIDETTSGVTSHYYPTPVVKEEEESVSEEDVDKVLENLVNDYELEIKKDSYSDLLYTFIKLSFKKDYFQEMKNLISTIINSDPIFYNDSLNRKIDIYYSKYREYIRENSETPEKDAYLKAYENYKFNITKKAQYVENDPVYVAKQIISIIDIMINRMKPESRIGSYKKLHDKLQDINPAELAAKKSPGGAALGISISLLKNILISRDPFFINVVIQEVLKRLIR